MLADHRVGALDRDPARVSNLFLHFQTGCLDEHFRIVGQGVEIQQPSFMGEATAGLFNFSETGFHDSVLLRLLTGSAERAHDENGTMSVAHNLFRCAAQ